MTYYGNMTDEQRAERIPGGRGTAVHHSVLYKAVPLGAWLLKGAR